jgi:hypothetical protein
MSLAASGQSRSVALGHRSRAAGPFIEARSALLRGWNYQRRTPPVGLAMRSELPARGAQQRELLFKHEPWPQRIAHRHRAARIDEQHG